MVQRGRNGKRTAFVLTAVLLAAAFAGSRGMEASAGGQEARENVDAHFAAGEAALPEGEENDPVEKDALPEGEETAGTHLDEGVAGEAALSGNGKEQGKDTETEKNVDFAKDRILDEEAAALTGAAGEAVPARSRTAAAEKGETEEEVKLVMTSVDNILNVRSDPGEDAEKVGYLYADCGGAILERRDGWTKLESGSLTGWAKDEYLLFGEDALREARDVGRTVAHVTGETVRIRKEPSADAAVYDLAAKGETMEVLDEAEIVFSGGVKIGSEWTAVDWEGSTGYVSTQYISVDFEYDTGETLEEVAARQEGAADSEQDGNGTEKDGDSGQKQERKKQNAGGIPAGTSDVTLLAALIQCEAGSEIYDGQVAVGAVVVNRVKSPSYPNTISDVIFASGQFGPAGSGKLARLIESGKIKESCIQAANEALAGITNVGSATHFRRAGSRDGIVIGNHVFW